MSTVAIQEAIKLHYALMDAEFRGRKDNESAARFRLSKKIGVPESYLFRLNYKRPNSPTKTSKSPRGQRRPTAHLQQGLGHETNNRIPSRAAIGTAIGQIAAVAMMAGLFFGLVWPGAGEGF